MGFPSAFLSKTYFKNFKRPWRSFILDLLHPFAWHSSAKLLEVWSCKATWPRQTRRPAQVVELELHLEKEAERAALDGGGRKRCRGVSGKSAKLKCFEAPAAGFCLSFFLKQVFGAQKENIVWMFFSRPLVAVFRFLWSGL